MRPSIWSGDGETISFGDRFDGKNPYTIDPKFNFPPTYQNIVDIVAKLRELNPDAKIIFQKVYNPVYEGTTLITKWEYRALAEKGYDTIAKVRELAGHLLGYLNGMLDEYNEKNPDNTVYTLDIYKAFDDVTKSDVKDGVVDLSANSLGRSLIYQDFTHPSNFGHAVIAEQTQKMLEEMGIASADALEKYKEIKCDQLDRIYSGVEGFDIQAAKAAVNSATTYYATTRAYFDKTDGYTPVNY